MDAALNKNRAPTEVDELVGKRIRAERLRLKFSQSELAAAVGVTYQQIQKYENGTDRVAASRLIQIAEYLGVAPAKLLDEADTEYAPLMDDLALEVVAEFAKLESAHMRKAAIKAFGALVDAEQQTEREARASGRG